MVASMRRDSPWLALVLLMAISTVGFIDRIVVNVLVEPIKGEFQLSDTQVSFMGMAFTVLNIGVGLVVARYAERVRRLSLISDYFPANKRGLAISVLMLAPPIGAFVGFVGGGWIAQEFDWRFTFLIAALPGVLLGILAWLFIAEPPRGRHDIGAGDDVPPMSAVLRRLFALPSRSEERRVGEEGGGRWARWCWSRK